MIERAQQFSETLYWQGFWRQVAVNPLPMGI